MIRQARTFISLGLLVLTASPVRAVPPDTLRTPQKAQSGAEELQTSLSESAAARRDAGLEETVRQAQAYLATFQHRPIATVDPTLTSGAPVTYPVEPATWDRVIELAYEVSAAPSNDPATIRRIHERVVGNPYVLAKLAVIYQHAPIMLGAVVEKEVNGQRQRVPDPQQQAEIVKTLIRQYATDDAVLRFAERAMADVTVGGRPFAKVLAATPALFAQAVLIHEAAPMMATTKELQEVYLQATLRQLATTGALDLSDLQMMLDRVRGRQPDHVRIGETIFWQPLLDPETLSVVPYLVHAAKRGLTNVELSADLLPFWPGKGPTKRLPQEYPTEERARIRAVAELFGVSLTVHTPIVGPFAQGRQLLEDPADNVAMMEAAVDFAADIGAKVVVVHIANRRDPTALDRYAQIALRAVGRQAADGTPLKIGFENYWHVTFPDKSKPFPQIEEHVAAFAEVVRRAAARDPAVLRHAALLIDSAHLNLVTKPMTDPVEAAYRLLALADAFATEMAPTLATIDLSREAFLKGLVAEVHLNSNNGPIRLLRPLLDFSADIHAPVETKGPIANDGVVALLRTVFSDFVVLAEQQEALSDEGRALLTRMAIVSPSPSPEVLIDSGMRALKETRRQHPGLYAQLAPLLEGSDGRPTLAYAWLVGRFGLEWLTQHLQQRAYQSVLCAHALPDGVTHDIEQPVAGVTLRWIPPNTAIIAQGTTLEQARRQGSAFFYHLVDGDAIVIKKVDGVEAERYRVQPGFGIGEALFLAPQHVRTADVVTGPQGLWVYQFTEEAFWQLRRDPSIRLRMDHFHEARQLQLKQAEQQWRAMSPSARVHWFFESSGVPVAADRAPLLRARIEQLLQEYPDPSAALRMLIEVGNNGSAWPLLVATVFPHATIDVIDIDPASFQGLQDLSRTLRNRTPGQLMGTLRFQQADGAELVPAKGYRADSADHAGATDLFVGQRYEALRDQSLAAIMADPSSVPLRVTVNLLNVVRAGGTVAVSRGAPGDLGPYLDHAALVDAVAARTGVVVERVAMMTNRHGADIAVYRLAQKPADWLMTAITDFGMDPKPFKASAATGLEEPTAASVAESPTREQDAAFIHKTFARWAALAQAQQVADAEPRRWAVLIAPSAMTPEVRHLLLDPLFPPALARPVILLWLAEHDPDAQALRDRSFAVVTSPAEIDALLDNRHWSFDRAFRISIYAVGDEWGMISASSHAFRRWPPIHQSLIHHPLTLTQFLQEIYGNLLGQESLAAAAAHQTEVADLAVALTRYL